MVVARGGSRAALEFVSPLDGGTPATGSGPLDGATWLRAARARQAGVEMIHVRIPRSSSAELQPDQLVGDVMEQLRNAGVDVPLTSR